MGCAASSAEPRAPDDDESESDAPSEQASDQPSLSFRPGKQRREPCAVILKLKRMRLQFGARSSDLTSRFDTYTGHPVYYPCHALVVYIRRWLRDLPVGVPLLPPASMQPDTPIPDAEVFAVYEPGTVLLEPALEHLKGAAPIIRLSNSIQLDALAEYLTTGFVPTMVQCDEVEDRAVQVLNAEAVTACEDNNA